MTNYKLAIIWGINEKDRNIFDGTIERFGKIEEESLHILTLLEIARTRFKDLSLFQILNERHLPEIAAFIFTMFGHIVFLNITKDEKKYGKTGIFLMPSKITEAQKTAFLSMREELQDYRSITLGYHLNLEAGMLVSDICMTDRGDLEFLLNNYLNKTNQNIIEKNKTL